MRMLVVNTCGSAGVVGLADEAGVRAERALPGRGAGEMLLPALRELFAEVGWLPGELAAVAAVDGPGSFTGIRVGLSAAKGLAEAAGCGLVAVSRLWLLAGEEEALGLLDAGRGEVFAGWWEEARWVERLVVGDAAETLRTGRMAVTCEAQVAERFGARLVEEPGARVIAAEALRRIRAGHWSDAATADANYLRRTDAELAEERR